MRTVICLTLALMSCAPLPGDPESGQAGQAGSAGERGPAGPAGRDAVAAGSRLRPLWLVGADGSRVAAAQSFWDAERGERCQVRIVPGSDMFVCAPPDLALSMQNAGAFVRFSMQQ